MVHGALIRASDKSNGPSRISQLSYGVEIMEEYDPEAFDAHKGIQPTMDKTDGRLYVNHTISWRIIKVRNTIDRQHHMNEVVILVGHRSTI